MSLIEEALRRVQDPALQGTQQTAPAAPAQPSSTTIRPVPPSPAKPAEPDPSLIAHPTTAHSWPTTPPAAPPSFGTESPKTITAPLLAIALAILTITAVLIIAGAFWMGRALGGAAPQPQSTPAQTMALPAAPAAMSARPSKPHGKKSMSAPTTEPLEQRLVLNGIVEGSGKPYAVINGTIVAIGEQFQDFTLLEISNGVARLRRTDGNEMLLRISR